MQRSPIKICTGVSQYLFRLATESVRLYSNKAEAISTLDDTVNGVASRALTIVPEYGPAAVQEHFRIIPTEGRTTVNITILASNAATYVMAAEMLASVMSRRMEVLDAVSLALYDLVAEQEIAQLANKLGISADAAAGYRRLIRETDSNVVPFR